MPQEHNAFLNLGGVTLTGRVYNKPTAELDREIAAFEGRGKDWEVQA